jgi:uncharacterized membrane protein YeiH
MVPQGTGDPPMMAIMLPSETSRSARWLSYWPAKSSSGIGLQADVDSVLSGGNKCNGREQSEPQELAMSNGSASASTFTVEESLPRLPVPWGGVPAALRALDWLCSLVFAVEGSITAASTGMDLLGVVIVGTITAIGGGTVRDVFVLHRQPFWVSEPEYVAFAVFAAFLTFFTWPIMPAGNAIKADSGEPGALIWWLDSLGVGAFAVIGAHNGMRAHITPALSVVSGMLTATFGGVVRDVLCSLPVRILHNHAEIYAVAALTGATLYVLSRRLGLRYGSATILSITATLLLRCLAVRYSLVLPSWHVDALHSTSAGLLRGHVG